MGYAIRAVGARGSLCRRGRLLVKCPRPPCAFPRRPRRHLGLDPTKAISSPVTDIATASRIRYQLRILYAMVRPSVPRSMIAQLVQREARANASMVPAIRRHVWQSATTATSATRARRYSASATSRSDSTSTASPASPERSTWYTSPADSFDAKVSAHDDIRCVGEG